MPDESQNRVAVMSAMTVLTPGAMADPRCSPARPASAMSISAGSAMTTAGKCCESATTAIPGQGGSYAAIRASPADVHRLTGLD
jgi:hypothetical protein